MTKKITRKNFLAGMRKAVEDRGEGYIYPEDEMFNDGCQYKREDGSPSCIIGYVLNYIDPKLVPERGDPIKASEVLAALGVEDDYLIDAATTAQSLQDNQLPWGAALARFEKSLGVQK